VQGLVLTRQQESDGELDGWPTVRSGSAAADAEPAAAAAVTATTARMMPTPSLERRASVAGSILIVERADADGDGRNPSREPIRNGQQQQPPYYAFMLQRKVKSAPFGTVRVGYALQNAKNDHGVTVADHAHNTHSVWEVAGRNRSAGGACGFGETSEIEDEEGLVAVSIRERAKVLPEPRHANTGASQDPRGELSALQMVAEASARRGGEDLHVVGTRLVAADAAHVYTVTPFCKDGSLFDYCMRRGTLREDEARFFFRQILKVRTFERSNGVLRFSASVASQ
jgi:serine/threonine protein kinase